MTTVSIPSFLDAARLAQLLPSDVRARFLTWDLHGDPPGTDPAAIDLVVSPFTIAASDAPELFVPRPVLAAALRRTTSVRLVQLLSVGFEGVPGLLPPGVPLANGVGVMERQTAEHALALVLALRRDLHHYRDARRWAHATSAGLIGARVMLLGHGGVGREIERRLAGFDTVVTRVASRARTLPDGRELHGVDELPDLLPTTDVLVCSLPMSAATRGLLGQPELAALPDGACLVNVGRGPVVDTDALLAETASGRLCAGIDVTDPDPLPADHPLWQVPGVLITPHVGGDTVVMWSAMHELVAAQAARLARGEEPANLVVRGG